MIINNIIELLYKNPTSVKSRENIEYTIVKINQTYNKTKNYPNIINKKILILNTYTKINKTGKIQLFYEIINNLLIAFFENKKVTTYTFHNILGTRITTQKGDKYIRTYPHITTYESYYITIAEDI